MRMKRFLTIVQILLVVIIIILVTKLFKHIWKTSKNAQIMRNYNKISNADEQTSSTCETTIWITWKINKDIVGWIKLSGTSLNYPVLQGKTNHDYLNLDFEREHRRKGSIFMDFRNELKNLNHNTIIYGHHVGDNTMFDVLEDYLAIILWKHKIIEFDNKYGKYQLQVFSAYKTTTKDNYIRTDFENDQDYQQF